MDSSNLCRLARRHFSDRIDGQPMPLSSRVVVGLHLRICPYCRRVQRSLEATREALGMLRDSDPLDRSGDPFAS